MATQERFFVENDPETLRRTARILLEIHRVLAERGTSEDLGQSIAETALTLDNWATILETDGIKGLMGSEYTNHGS
jgi:hypothetical protein